MKVCVFGATGYLGASIYRKLSNYIGDHVVGTYRTNPIYSKELYQLDINDPEAFSAFYKEEKPDAVVWAVRSDQEEEVLVNNGLTHLLTHLTPETKLIYVSSDRVFSEGDGPYGEEITVTKLPEDHPQSNYTNAKIKAEYLIENELSQYLILRSGPLYGQNELGKWDKRTQQLEKELSNENETVRSAESIRTFVHVQDLSSLIIEMLHREERGIYHAGPSKSESYFSFSKKMAEQIDWDSNLIVKEEKNKEVLSNPLDTSLHTDKLRQIVNTRFREVPNCL